MKIVAISDSHLYRPHLPDADILIHAGDLCSRGTQQEFFSEIPWLAKHPAAHKLFVPGNHDRWVESAPSLAKKYCEQYGIRMLIDESVEIDGLTFYGSPWTPVFGNWAFLHDQDQASHRWQRLQYSDVLITHGPPYSVFDTAREDEGPLGCPHLYAGVKRAQPAVHLFGHIHEGAGHYWPYEWEDTKKVTLFANIAVLNGRYKPNGHIFVLEV
jgi:Icc-related predicted phosphoesterase